MEKVRNGKLGEKVIGENLRAREGMEIKTRVLGRKRRLRKGGVENEGRGMDGGVDRQGNNENEKWRWRGSGRE